MRLSRKYEGKATDPYGFPQPRPRDHRAPPTKTAAVQIKGVGPEGGRSYTTLTVMWSGRCRPKLC